MTGAQVADRVLDVLEAVARLGTASLPDIRRDCGLSTATAHRIMQGLLRRGFIMKCRRGSYRIGTSALALTQATSMRHLLEAAARPHVSSLARRTGSHAHLGIFEDGMVTYLVKQRFGKSRLHSAEGTQLEAYCSALGKVLLAGLPDLELDRYLSEGAFVELTERTITDPALLRRAIGEVRTQGWAADNEEIAKGLWCMAVPLLDQRGEVLGAISISSFSEQPPTDHMLRLEALLETANAIHLALFPERSDIECQADPLPNGVA